MKQLRRTIIALVIVGLSTFAVTGISEYLSRTNSTINCGMFPDICYSQSLEKGSHVAILVLTNKTNGMVINDIASITFIAFDKDIAIFNEALKPISATTYSQINCIPQSMCVNYLFRTNERLSKGNTATIIAHAISGQEYVANVTLSTLAMLDVTPMAFTACMMGGLVCKNYEVYEPTTVAWLVQVYL